MFGNVKKTSEIKSFHKKFNGKKMSMLNAKLD